MLIRPITMAILITAAQATCAASYSYDFSGTLEDHFNHQWVGQPPSTVVQSGGKLIFHTQGVAIDWTDEYFVYHPIQPTYQQSWSAEIQVTVPASLDNQTKTNNGDFLADAALAVFNVDSQGAPDKIMAIDMESTPPDGHYYWAGHTTVGSGVEDGMAFIQTGDATGMLGLRFDATTKVLSAYTVYGTLLSVDIDDPASDWKMQGNAPLFLAIGFDADGMFVSENEPISIDNFNLTIAAVPEPETYALILVGIGLVGLAARRRHGIQHDTKIIF